MTNPAIEKPTPESRAAPPMDLIHIKSTDFRTVFASGGIFMGPLDNTGNWQVVFFSDEFDLEKESIGTGMTAPATSTYLPTSDGGLQYRRIRRDEARIVIHRDGLLSLAEAIVTSLRPPK